MYFKTVYWNRRTQKHQLNPLTLVVSEIELRFDHQNQLVEKFVKTERRPITHLIAFVAANRAWAPLDRSSADEYHVTFVRLWCFHSVNGWWKFFNSRQRFIERGAAISFHANEWSRSFVSSRCICCFAIVFLITSFFMAHFGIKWQKWIEKLHKVVRLFQWMCSSCIADDVMKSKMSWKRVMQFHMRDSHLLIIR